MPDTTVYPVSPKSSHMRTVVPVVCLATMRANTVATCQLCWEPAVAPASTTAQEPGQVLKALRQLCGAFSIEPGGSAGWTCQSW